MLYEKIKNISYNTLLVMCWGALLVISVGKGLAGKVEGHFFPVVTQLQITGVEEDRFGAIISGNFEKLRDCDLMDIDLRLSKNGNESKLFSLTRIEDPREIGPQQMKELLVNTTPDNIRNTVGFTIHKCHGMYNTQTQFIGER